MNLNLIPIISVATLIELKMKNDDWSGIYGNLNLRTAENPTVNTAGTRLARVSEEDDSDDDKPISLVLKRKVGIRLEDC